MARSNLAPMAERTTNTKQASMPSANRATVDVPAGEPKVVITRWFDAPRALVFDAMNKPEHVRRWWGLRGSKMLKCEIDFRVGGQWHYVLGEADGNQIGFKGTYREIEAPEHVVQTMVYDVDFYRDHPAVENIRLEEIGARTKLTNTIVYEAIEFRDGHVASGMEWGMNETFGRLDELLVDLSRGSSVDRARGASKDLVLDRVFDAPRDLVFRAWTDPKMVARWWGPHHFDAPRVELDVRAGGAIRIDMRAPDGTVLPMGGFFREVTPPEKLVFTARAMEDADGNAQLETLNTVTFTAYGDKTGVHLHVRVVYAAPAAQPALAGMAEGWTQALDKMGAFVKAAAE